MIRLIFIGICLLFTASCSTSYKISKDNYINPVTKDTSLNKDNYQNNNLIDKISNDHNSINLLTPNEVLTLLGDPTLINRVNNIEIWQYRKDFTLNIIWDKFNTLKSNIPKHIFNQNVNPEANEVKSTIIWLECVSPDKSQKDPNYCFLQLTDF